MSQMSHCCYNNYDSFNYSKILDLSEFKAFTANNFNVAQLAQLSVGRVENILGKEENAGY